MSVYVPFSVYLQAMEFAADEDPAAILTHAVGGLARSGLVEQNYSLGTKEYLAKTFPGATEAGFIMTPNLNGAEVFLWGQGIKGATGHEVVLPALKLSPPEFAIPIGALPVRE